MKRQYVCDLVEGAAVDSEFALRSKELRLARSGDGYLVLDLADRTGVIPAVLFRPGRLATEIDPGCVVTVRGVVTTYRGQKRVSIDAITPAGTYHREDMVPGTLRDRRELLAELKRLITRLRQPALTALVRSVFADRAFTARFLAAPSSAGADHAYVGGLLEHTVAVAHACGGLAEAHPEADADELLAAALLHDIGKVDAYVFDTAVEATDEGRLIGHVALGHARLTTALALAEPPLEPQAAARLCHAVLAHHEGEDGSGVAPVTLEALLLRQADAADRSSAEFIARTATAARLDQSWTAPSRPGGRALSVPGHGRVLTHA